MKLNFRNLLTFLFNCKRDEEKSSDNSGVEGILRRIKQQRSLTKDRKGYGQPSYNKRELDPGEGGTHFGFLLLLHNSRPLAFQFWVAGARTD
jgi:hypothetical protein